MRVFDRAIELGDGWVADVFKDGCFYFANVFDSRGVLVTATREYVYREDACAVAEELKRSLNSEA